MPLFVAGLLTGLVLGLLLGFILFRRAAAPAASPFSPASSPTSPAADTFRSLLNAARPLSQDPVAAEPESQLVTRLRQDLRIKFLYQEDKIDQAIEAERDRNPAATLPQLLQAAIDRWERENR